jgi:hypothetical protein
LTKLKVLGLVAIGHKMGLRRREGLGWAAVVRKNVIGQSNQMNSRETICKVVSIFRPLLKLSVTLQILVSDCVNFCAAGLRNQTGAEASSDVECGCANWLTAGFPHRVFSTHTLGFPWTLFIQDKSPMQ